MAHTENLSSPTPQGLETIDSPASQIIGPLECMDSEPVTANENLQPGNDDTEIRPEEKTTNFQVTERGLIHSGIFSNSSRKPRCHRKSGNYVSRFLRFCEDRWLLEVACCIFAFCNLLAIILVLATHQGRSVPNWPNVISVNSLISIFTALMKASMMVAVSEAISQMKWQWFTSPHALIDMEHFDSATRGPLGAFSLMVKVRKHRLASLGAFITIVALAIDPFSQQIIQYYTCSADLPGAVASLPRANNYTFGGMSSLAGHAELDSTMAAAMYLGTIDPPVNPSSTIPFQCHTGNCTFPTAHDGATFSTIGMCYSTMDITSYVKKNITYGIDFGFWLPDLSWGHDQNDTAYLEASVGNFSYGDGSHISAAQSSLTINNSHFIMLYTKKGIADGPGFSPDFDSLFTFDTLMLNVDSSCNVMNGDIYLSEKCVKHPWAVRISLYPCIKTFHSSITNSFMNETLIATKSLRRTNASAVEITTTPNLTWSLATDTILVNGNWQKCHISDSYADSTPVPISINNTLQLDLNEPTKWYPAECVWMLDYIPGLAINQFLSWMYDESPLLSVTNNTVITSGSIWLKPFYKNGTANIDSINNYTDGLTSTMTAIMRQRGSSAVLGTVQANQTCINVVWVWISLPAALMIFTLVLLAGTVITCNRTEMWKSTGSWRSSSLALLFHGCDTVIREQAGGLVRKADMEELSKLLTVAYAETDEGLQLVKKDSA